MKGFAKKNQKKERADIVNHNIDIYNMTLYHSLIDPSLRSSTFQTFRRALNFENPTTDKYVMGTFLIVWSDILFTQCLYT